MVQKTKAERREQFEGFDYPVQIVGRNVEITDPMKTYALEKLSKVERLGGHVIDATIVMDIQKQSHAIDFLINLNGTLVKVAGRTNDMYASVDQAIDRLKLKLARYLDRLHDHHNKGLKAIELEVNMVKRSFVDDINDAIEEETLSKVEEELKPGEIVEREKQPLKTLTQEEAIMKMDLTEAPFLVYRGEDDHKLRVIYKHDDQKHYGIIDLPE